MCEEINIFLKNSRWSLSGDSQDAERLTLCTRNVVSLRVFGVFEIIGMIEIISRIQIIR